MFIVSVDQAVGDVPPNFIALIPERMIISDDISKKSPVKQEVFICSVKLVL